jgi:butyrate kinase
VERAPSWFADDVPTIAAQEEGEPGQVSAQLGHVEASTEASEAGCLPIVGLQPVVDELEDLSQLQGVDGVEGHAR